MESPRFSLPSSLSGDFKCEDYIQPHYKESYRLAIDHLVNNGKDGYLKFLKEERIGSFLSEEELLFITENAEQLSPETQAEEISGDVDSQSSSGTYWPTYSDEDTPDLDLGWPEVMHERLQTNIDLLFHPPRQNNPTIKEVVRKHIQDARQVIAIAMDQFTDVDLFKEIVDASSRGVPVYVLLDDYHLKGFLKMAETQDVKIQQLRNMRVRTVKGQNYLCRSGAKFHGAMEQRFLLVDSQIAVYGSYSFTWSYEKINLSMVQVITGHLVKSYDEEFRTLYARSTVPAELCPPEPLFQHIGQVRQILPKYGPPKIDRTDHLRHTLDTVYRKACERQLGIRDLEERLYEQDSPKLRPVVENGISAHKPIMHLLSPEEKSLRKRHSYAGERQNTYLSENIRPRASNWNICHDMDNGINNFLMENYSQMPKIYRNQPMRQLCHGNDKPILPIQQNMPLVENASKSFMRTWRIESYLKSFDVPLRDSCDYLDQFESLDKANSFMQGRLRNSLIFRSAIPEQIETNRHMNNSFTALPSALPNAALHYSSMQWNPSTTAESRTNNEDFKLKRQSLQMLDDSRENLSYGPGRNAYPSTYVSLSRTKGPMMMIKTPDIMTDSWQKRHSVADPRSNVEYELSGHMYGSAYGRTQVHRSTAGINVPNGGYKPHLNEDQRSMSHYDVKTIMGKNDSSTPICQEPPCRTVSAAVLEMNTRDLTVKSNNMNSQAFLQKSSRKIRSFLNMPEKKEGSAATSATPSLKSVESTDTLTADDEAKSDGTGRKHAQNISSSVKSSAQQKSQKVDEHFKSSIPRFKTEDDQYPQPSSPPKPPATQQTHPVSDTNVRPSLDGGNWRKGRGAEPRLYSRYEPFCAVEKKPAIRLTTTKAHSQEKPKTAFKGDAAVEHNISRTVRGHHENKLEKFIHRVGNLIHKNK
ncbi:protein FAM83B [Thalassophryne amazonica]|uniref:protein FAM83B n=1 Tax=Thalassophryne amazonica TaxID=390379 RepID=UPI0014722EFD|nr:protein FAM83B [Thalassophryne amazonica]